MRDYLIKGSSSLLFLVSFVNSLRNSDLILWKISNSIIVVASFLCNANDYTKHYLMLDYLCIIFVCTSYLNNYKVNTFLFLYSIFEYYNKRTIENAKNVSYGLSTVAALVNTYYYCDSANFIIILTSSLSGMTIYKIRYTLLQNENQKYNLLLTYLMHVCAMNIMYVSSFTACHKI
jgi:hypothetical protein